MLIVLDNAELILDPQGTNAQEIYDVVDELCRFKTISVCITSRITSIPQHCKRLVVPTHIYLKLFEFIQIFVDLFELIWIFLNISNIRNFQYFFIFGNSIIFHFRTFPSIYFYFR